MRREIVIFILFYTALILFIILIGLYIKSRENNCEKLLNHSVFYEEGNLKRNYSIGSVRLAFSESHFWNNMTGYYDKGNRSIYYDPNKYRWCKNVWFH